MATWEIPLPVELARPGDGSSTNAFPGYRVVKSSASDPKPFNGELLFDAGTDEAVFYTFPIPNNYVGSPVLRIWYKMTSATSGAVRFECYVACVTPGDSQDVDANAFDSSNSAGDTVPGTAGYLDSFTITLTNKDSMAAGDLCTLRINRDADGTSGTDNATGDCEVMYFQFEYSDV